MNQQSSIFSHISSNEKKQKWFLLIKTLIQARISKGNTDESKLFAELRVLKDLVNNNDYTFMFYSYLKMLCNFLVTIILSQKEMFFALLRFIKYGINA